MQQKHIFYIMGVSGSGKSTIGQLLAQKTNLPFFDADDFHPIENVEKMKAGLPLNDEDRHPWLLRLNQLAIDEEQRKGAIITCSALKKKYRILLEQNLQNAPHWIFLKGDFQTILKRMEQRKGHYMPASLLTSQFDALEMSNNLVTYDIVQPPTSIVQDIYDLFFQN